MKPQPYKLLDLIRKYNRNIYPVAIQSMEEFDSLPQDSSTNASYSRQQSAENGRAADVISNVRLRADSGLKPCRKTTPFKYFLDGCRRTYYLCDMATRSGSIVPLVAGQFSSAVVERNNDNGKVSLYDYERKSIIIIPSGADGLDSEDADDLIEEIEERFKGRHFTAKKLDIKTGKKQGQKNYDDKKPQDKAIARINMEMQALEIRYLEEMTTQKTIGEKNMVIVDGPLQFQRAKDKNRAFLRYALGVSKHFDIYLENLVEKNKQIGAHLFHLKKVGDRTSAYVLHDDSSHISYAFWYLRIQPREHLNFPFAGLIRVEKALIDPNERDGDISSDLIDYLSSYILLERSVNPYGLDFRWASHLYPIYLTEQIQKTRFLSDHFFYSLLK